MTGLSRQWQAQLEKLPFVQEAHLSLGDGPARGEARLLTPSGEVVLPVWASRSHLSREAALAATHEASERDALLVLAPSIGRDVGNLLEEAGVNFIDTAGNSHMRLLDHYFVRVQGRRGQEVPALDRGMRAPAYRMLLSLMIDAALLNATAREMAQVAQVSPQTALNLRKKLDEMGLVVSTRSNCFWESARWHETIAMWLHGFRNTLRSSLLLGRFRSRYREIEEQEEKLENALKNLCEWRYGGGAASGRMSRFYRGPQTVVYLDDPPSDIASKLGLVPSRSGPIHLMNVPTKNAFTATHERCVHPLLVYADLLCENDPRASEAAEEIYTELLSAPPDQ